MLGTSYACGNGNEDMFVYLFIYLFIYIYIFIYLDESLVAACKFDRKHRAVEDYQAVPWCTFVGTV